MLRQKWPRNAREIIKYGPCVNQNVAKQNMEARKSYLLEKKEIEKKKKSKSIKTDQVTPDSSREKVKKVKEN